MNLGEIYNQVYLLLGKDSYGGLLSPPDFNLAIQKVNDDLTNAYITVIEDNQTITDEVLPFVKTLGDNEFAPLPITSFGYGTLPEDYVRYLSARHYQYYNNNCGTPTAKIRPIEMLSQGHFDMRLQAGMYFPTKSRPIATMQNDKLYVQPTGISEVVFTYFRQPLTPYFDYDIVTASGQPIFLPPDTVHGSLPNTTVNANFTAGDPSLSVEFEWPDNLDTDIVNRIKYYIAINIKDYPLTQVATESKPIIS